MSLEQALEKWAKSPAGKSKLNSKMREAVKQQYRSRGSSAPAVGGGQSPDFYANEFINILRAEIALDGFEYGDYLYRDDIGYDEASGKYEIHVNFYRDELHRDSLYPEKYQDGIENIAALMNAGYDADGYVYGEWPQGSGNRIRSRKNRQGAYFIQAAVEKFNAMYGTHALAECGDEYEGTRVNFNFW